MEIKITEKYRTAITEAIHLLKMAGQEYCVLPNLDELKDIEKRMNEYHPLDVIAEILKSDNYKDNKGIYYKMLEYILKVEVHNHPTEGFLLIDGQKYDYWEQVTSKLNAEDKKDVELLEKMIDFASFLQNHLESIKRDMAFIFGEERRKSKYLQNASSRLRAIFYNDDAILNLFLLRVEEIDNSDCKQPSIEIVKEVQALRESMLINKERTGKELHDELLDLGFPLASLTAWNKGLFKSHVETGQIKQIYLKNNKV